MGNKISPNELGGSVGLTWVDGEVFYLVNFSPELTFGNFGAGLDVNFRINKEGKLQKGDYDNLRFIRYLRWGHKGDDVYARLGVLDYARLGHGFILYNYKNSPSYEDRRNGVELDWNFGSYGFESVYGDFARAGVIGVRVFRKPFKMNALEDFPILGDAEVGFTIASDVREDAKGRTVDSTGKVHEKGTVGIYGLDVGFPLIRKPGIQSTFYIDFAKILSYGSGAAIGLLTDVPDLGIFDLSSRIERRFPGKKFIANYFDTFYEIDRLTKIKYLETLTNPSPGIFADLTVGLFNTLYVVGTYQQLDDIDESGILHVGTSTGTLIPVIDAEAGYDKKFIKNFEDLRTLDERSLMYVSAGYKPYPFMKVALIYTWTFKKNTKGIYEAQERVEQRVTFSYPL
ncbi:MAG: hypothetical protein KGZ58_11910 [Ignavibacteriales bacterium]|nr:hypothetical protein [Ignavibacteriales bacterium]